MNCPDCRDRLQQWFDARTPDVAPPVLCPACAQWGVAAGRLVHGLRLLAAPAPPAYLADRIIARLRTRRRRVRLLFAAGAVAAAATVLLAVWLSFAVRQPTRPDAAPSVVAKTPKPESSAPSVNLRDSVAQAGSAMASLTSRTADETVAKTKALLPLPVDSSLSKPDAPAAPARSLRETGESVTAGLEPVADSARRAVSLFFRELPPMDANPKTGF
jgi:hypothetical protein